MCPILPQEEGGYYATTELLRSADQGATWTTVNIDGIEGEGVLLGDNFFDLMPGESKTGDLQHGLHEITDKEE